MECLFDYWNPVRHTVCRHCIDADRDGNCRLGAGEQCALQTFFPRIVKAVESVHSDSIEPYIASLRHDVCAICSHQDDTGYCHLRHGLDCALDRYYPLVVAAIEDVESLELAG